MARASGVRAGAPSSGRREAQACPPSRVSISGEKVRFWLGRNPVTSAGPLLPASTRPPLSAVPGGVTSCQRVLPAGRRNSCQKSLYWAADPPITVTAHVPAGVTREVSSDGAGCVARVTGAGGGAAALPHPAASAVPATATATAMAMAGGPGGPLPTLPPAPPSPRS